MRKKMTREGRLRRPHRREWPGFLQRLIADQTWRGLEGLANRGMDPRTRWSPKLILLCWVVMGWSIQGQLTERFREGRETLAWMFLPSPALRRKLSGADQGDPTVRHGPVSSVLGGSVTESAACQHFARMGRARLLPSCNDPNVY